MIAFNRTRARELASRTRAADAPLSRAVGLLGRDSMDREEALWIVPCSMVHTFFMRFPIDLLFLDRELKVVKVVEGLKPWRLSPWVLGAHSVLELASGALRDESGASRAAAGDALELR
ncbi:MAG TPA: DUF192 domain-containing protein [Elusimicrobia bacterium]|nr:DUF192 domain-containing protein [Elusimicrobiota bacterium]